MKYSYQICLKLVVICILFGATPAISQPIFNNKIPIPTLIDVNNHSLDLDITISKHKFNPKATDSLNGNNQNGIEVWSYSIAGQTSNTYLGPTLRWVTNDSVKINIHNKLGVPTTHHWHGADVPVQFDGGPHTSILSNNTWTVKFKNLNNTSTLWYHPHYHNYTAKHVQRGLSGLIISENKNDTIRPKIPHEYGIDDIPVIISDQKIINNNGVFEIDTNFSTRPINLVNGVSNPFLTLPKHLIRLRILNASSSKGMLFSLSDSYTNLDINTFIPFIHIATDNGYTIEPQQLKTLLLGPGERAEILIDLTKKTTNDILYLRNLKQISPLNMIGSTRNQSFVDTVSGNAFLQIRIGADSVGHQYFDTFNTFNTKWESELSDTLNVSRRRIKYFSGYFGDGYKIDGTSYDMDRIDDTVCVNTKEIWTIYNYSQVAHPFHIHKVGFRVLEMTGSTNKKLNLDSMGLNGLKDDVLILPYSSVKFLVYFKNYPTKISKHLTYMYHCHILDHEDASGGGMMHQFVVTNENNCVELMGVELNENLESSIFYPNPSDGLISINTENIGTATIYDLNGALIFEQYFNESAKIKQLQLKNNLNSGMYLIKYATNESIITQKIIIE